MLQHEGGGHAGKRGWRQAGQQRRFEEKAHDSSRCRSRDEQALRRPGAQGPDGRRRRGLLPYRRLLPDVVVHGSSPSNSLPSIAIFGGQVLISPSLAHILGWLLTDLVLPSQLRGVDLAGCWWNREG